MNSIRTFTLLVSVALATLLIAAAPALAQEDVDDVAEVEQEAEDDAAEDDDHRIALAETPRDRVALLLFGAMALGGTVAFIHGRRQMKGSHEQASGDFRWR